MFLGVREFTVLALLGPSNPNTSIKQVVELAPDDKL